jgi:hypothetical protein
MMRLIKNNKRKIKALYHRKTGKGGSESKQNEGIERGRTRLKRI